MTAHEDPDHGIKHCHHPFVVENCNACWNALPNAELRGRLNRQDFVDDAAFGEKLRRWASDRRIEDIPAEFDRLRGEADKAGEKDRRIEQLEAENADLRSKLRDVIASLGRRGRYWGRK